MFCTDSLLFLDCHLCGPSNSKFHGQKDTFDCSTKFKVCLFAIVRTSSLSSFNILNLLLYSPTRNLTALILHHDCGVPPRGLVVLHCPGPFSGRRHPSELRAGFTIASSPPFLPVKFFVRTLSTYRCVVRPYRLS